MAAKAPSPPAKRARDRKHSALTADALVAAILQVEAMGLHWPDVRAEVLRRREANQRHAQSDPHSDVALARRGVLTGAAQLSDFDAGRLSLLLEVMDAEVKNPKRLLAKGVYERAQGDHDNYPRKYEPERLVPLAWAMGYFEDGLTNPERKKIRKAIIRMEGLLEDGTSLETADRGVRRTLDKLSS